MRRFATSGAPFAVLCLLLAANHAAAAPTPSFSVGSGRSMVVEYDLDFRPLRKYIGLQNPVDITSLADGTILVVDAGSRRVLVFDTAGSQRWSEQIGDYPLRARPRPTGGLLVTSGEEVIALRADRTVEWQQHVKNITVAAPLANGNVVTATNDGNGWLTELTPQGEVVWRSKPRGHADASGQWIAEAPDQYLVSVRAADVGASGTIFAADYDGHRLHLISPEHQTLRTIAALHHAEDARIGPAGELVAVSPESRLVWVELPAGQAKSFLTNQRPTCANMSPNGTILVGLTWEPERAALNATAERARQTPDLPWRLRPLPIPISGSLLFLAISLAVRWPDIRRARLPAAANASFKAPAALPGAKRSAVLLTGCLVVLVTASYLASTSLDEVSGRFWGFALSCLVGGVALRTLNTLAGASQTLTSFSPAQSLPPHRHAARWRTTLLVGLSAASLAACVFVVVYQPNEQAFAIAGWLGTQIFILAAAFPPVYTAPAARAASRRTWPVLAFVLLAAIATRFWQMGSYPDYIHHDHSNYGNAVIQTFRGAWRPFFIMDPFMASGFSRPWLILALATLKCFGLHPWVLRLTAAVSSVGLAWATYLLGAALFNRRVGLIGAWLVTVNHALVLYSRQPYVIESTAPFILALYCAVVGMRRGCRWHWCLAGILSGWAMLSIRQCTTFPFIGGAIFAYMLCVYPRWLWRNRSGLLWLVAGAAAVYAPMVPHVLLNSALPNRIREVTVLLNPDGSIRWDAQVWATQLGRSFGAILYYSDSNPWQVSAVRPICLRWDACLFGMGLVYLLLSWRTPVTFIVLSGISVSIFLGSALFLSPPTYYHFFVAIVLILMVCAVAVDRLLALTDGWKPRWRVVPMLVALALVGAISVAQLDAAWLAVRRPPPSDDGRTVFRADPKVMTARFIGEHPQYRYYLLRSANDISSTDVILQFYGAGSDVSDITTSLDEALPVPPVEPAPGAAFILLPSRADEQQAIVALYPSATLEEVLYTPVPGKLSVLLVDGKTVREVYERAGRGARSAGMGVPQ